MEKTTWWNHGRIPIIRLYYSYWARISYPCSLRIFSFLKSCTSEATISFIISSNECLGTHHSWVLAFVGSHKSVCTSAGRKYLGSTSIRQLPVFLSYHFSSTPAPFRSISIHASWKANSVNSLTLCVFHVASTKSSGLSCWSINRIPST